MSFISLLIFLARLFAFSGALLYLAFNIEQSIRIHTELMIVLAVAKLSCKITCCAVSGSSVKWSSFSVCNAVSYTHLTLPTICSV